jgi:hypothetical protein
MKVQELKRNPLDPVNRYGQILSINEGLTINDIDVKLLHENNI